MQSIEYYCRRYYLISKYRSRDLSHAACSTQLSSWVTLPLFDWPDLPSCARAPTTMETLNLMYNDRYQLVICIEHGYCVAASSVKHHLNHLHNIKGDRLHAALAEANSLEIRDPRQVQPPTDAPAIPHLTIDSGFRCGIPACKLSKPFVSKSKRTIEKHLSKEHAVGHAKGKAKPTSIHIEAVCVQSFLPRPHYKAFAIQGEPEAPAPFLARPATPKHPSADADNAPHAETPPHAGFIDLRAQYQTSEQQWLESHEQFLPDDDQYIKQTPPWIKSTGIRNWVQGLGVEKKNIWDLVHAVHSSKILELSPLSGTCH